MKNCKKQLFGWMVIFTLIAGIISPLSALIGNAEGCTLVITADRTTVNVGESFTVTVAASGDNIGFIRGALQYNECVTTGDAKLGLYAGNLSASYVFQAQAAGTVTISAVTDSALDLDEAPMDMAVNPVTIEIIDPSATTPDQPTDPPADQPTDPPADQPTDPPADPPADQPTDPPADQPADPPAPPQTEPATTPEPTTSSEALSSNAYLEALSIYPGTLSPAFSAQTDRYTATVEYETTKLSVSVVTEDVDATYVITDTSLAVGVNIIDIKVTAADGTVKWYNLRVTRKGQETTEESTEATEESTTADTTEESTEDPLEIVIGSDTARILKALGDADRPEGFEEIAYTYRGVEIEALRGLGNKLLLFLVEDVTGSRLYIYNEDKEGFYPYVGIQISSALYTAMPFDSDETVPAGYQLRTIDFAGIPIDAWVRADAADNTFAVFYAMNWEGQTDLYRYDAEEGTLQRVIKEEIAVMTQTESQPSQETQGNTDSEVSENSPVVTYYEELINGIKRRDTIMFVIVVILLVCLIAMYLVFTSGKKDNPDDPDGGDSDDDDSDDAEPDDLDEDTYDGDLDEVDFDDEPEYLDEVNFDDEPEYSDDADFEDASANSDKAEFDGDILSDGRSDADCDAAGTNPENQADRSADSGIRGDELKQLQQELASIQQGMAGAVAEFDQADKETKTADSADPSDDLKNVSGGYSAQDSADIFANEEIEEMDLEDIDLEDLDL